MAKVIKTTGEIIDILPKNGNEFTFQEIQEVVGGHFEMIMTTDEKHYIFLNEEGKLLGLPLNTKATEIAYMNKKALTDLIVGDVLMANPQESGMYENN